MTIRGDDDDEKKMVHHSLSHDDNGYDRLRRHCRRPCCNGIIAGSICGGNNVRHINYRTC